MRNRFFPAAAAAAALFLATPAAAGGLASVFGGFAGNAVSEFFYDPPSGVVKVPWFGSCPDFEKNHSAAERQRVADMGALAEAAYQDGKKPPAGYSALSPAEAAKLAGPGFSVAKDGTVSLSGIGWASGFDAVLYRNDRTGEITVAFRGTQITSLGDLATDAAQIGTGSVPTQYKAAAELLRNVLAATDKPVAVAGHSLGGGLAQYAIAANSPGSSSRLSGYTFNSAGLSHAVVDSLSDAAREAAAARMTNIRNDGDSVSFFGCHLGTMYDVPNDGFFAHSVSILNRNLVGKDQLPPEIAEAAGGNGFEGILDNLRDGFAAMFPDGLSGELAAAAEDWLRAWAEREVARLAGKIDEALDREFARLEKKFLSLLPEGPAREAGSRLVSDLKAGNWDALAGDALDVGLGAGETALRDSLDRLGVHGAEQDAIVKGARDAVGAAIAGGDPVSAVGVVARDYVDGKIREKFGDDVADKFGKLWDAALDEGDPWIALGDFVDSVEVWAFDKFEEKVEDFLRGELDGLFARHPELTEMFGLSTDKLLDLGRNVWGVVTGDGTLAEKLGTVSDLVADALAEAFGTLVDWAVGKALEQLDAIVSKISQAVGKAVQKVLDKINRLVDKANRLVDKWNAACDAYLRKLDEILAGAGRVATVLGGDDWAEISEGIQNARRSVRLLHVDRIPHVSIPAAAP